MSGTAAVKPSGASGYEVARSLGRCAVTGALIQAGEKYMAALRETATGFERVDCSLACWEQLDKNAIVAFWKATQHPPEQKKKVFVDDDVLCSLFERLADTTEPAKLNFRFVLGLILMRKRLLLYESTTKTDGTEIWSVRLRGKDDLLNLLNPQLTEEQVLDVSRQLGEILNEDL